MAANENSPREFLKSSSYRLARFSDALTVAVNGAAKNFESRFVRGPLPHVAKSKSKKDPQSGEDHPRAYPVIAELEPPIVGFF
ncbi:MAG: hypothetical protein ABJP70_01160 [Erythrobacter sp.]